VDSSGNVYIADDFNAVIRKVDTLGIISTFATDPNFSGLGVIAIDSSNNLYVVDQGTCVIWKISPAAVVSVFAGVEFTCGYNGDNISALTAQLNIPVGVAVDNRGNVYIADANNNRVRKVNPSGVITTIAGDGNCGFLGDGGLGTSAELCFPLGVAVTSTGTVYIADTNNLRIRKLAAGIITTYAGTGISGFNGDVAALSANFDDPVAVTVNSSNVLYMLDDVTERVRKIH
jgi:sugar lactone lactonase YvrE